MLTVSAAHRSIAEMLDEQLGQFGSARVHRVSRRRSDYATSAPLEEVDVDLTDGSTLELTAKRLGRSALLGGAGEAKPDFVYDPEREVVVYELLSGEPGLPHYWGTLDEPDGLILVLERVPGLALRHIGELDHWLEAARWLAGFHARWAEPVALSPAARDRLLRYDVGHQRRLLERAERFSAMAGSPLSPVVVSGHAAAVEILARLPTSLVHGEFYASNVLVAQAGPGLRVAALDWETAGLGSPLLDLAALTSGEWEPWERASMVDAYHRAAPWGLDDAGFERALCAARLVVSVQWMGWATGWEPPADLISDWSGHAADMAEALVGSPAVRTGLGPRRTVIVNADDLGLSEGVNRGILEAHDHGIVTSASLMVRGPAAEEAAHEASTRPALAVGLHVDLAEWRFDDGSWRAVYEVVDVDDPATVQVEVERQIGRFVELVGRPPTHVDSHQHVHGRPVVGAAVRLVAERLRIPVRGEGTIAYVGDFYGQYATGEPLPEAITTENLIHLIEALPPGVSELACHPGYPEGLDSGYASEREVELKALCDPRVREALTAGSVELSSFKDVSAPAV